MTKTPLPSRKTGPISCSVSLSDLRRFTNGWVVKCRYRQLSPNTVGSRQGMLGKLVWWLEQNEVESCGRTEIQQFLSYVCDGHSDPEGRWGNPHERSQNRPSTAATFHSRLSSFFTSLSLEGFIETSPMMNLKAPLVRADQIQPFSEDQVKALLSASKGSKYPKRDEAILLFLLDTGMRASELIGLRMQDLDIVGKKAFVLGKGNKHRAVFFSQTTA